MRRRELGRVVLVVTMLLGAVLGVPGDALARRVLEATVDDLLGLEFRPFAIGHRGSGQNQGEDPGRPIENTVASVRAAYAAGLTVVEVDVQRTGDGGLPAFHDDFLQDDGICLAVLTLQELRARRPEIPSLQALLQQARQFNQASGPLRGPLIVELKAPSPRCDPADEQEAALVDSVVSAVRRLGMTDQVLLVSFSPALLYLAQQMAPEIARGLTVTGLQFLDPADVQAELGLPVRPISKALGLGLQWAEIGDLFRLPGYRSLTEMITTAAIVGARVIEGDAPFLAGGGPALVAGLQALGWTVLGYTADDAQDWQLLQSLGVDGIYTNDVALGLASQPPIP
jgi:glycerophosphoryl diester phosphodiesterase